MKYKTSNVIDIRRSIAESKGKDMFTKEEVEQILLKLYFTPELSIPQEILAIGKKHKMKFVDKVLSIDWETKE